MPTSHGYQSPAHHTGTGIIRFRQKSRQTRVDWPARLRAAVAVLAVLLAMGAAVVWDAWAHDPIPPAAARASLPATRAAASTHATIAPGELSHHTSPVLRFR